MEDRTFGMVGREIIYQITGLENWPPGMAWFLWFPGVFTTQEEQIRRQPFSITQDLWTQSRWTEVNQKSIQVRVCM